MKRKHLLIVALCLATTPSLTHAEAVTTCVVAYCNQGYYTYGVATSTATGKTYATSCVQCPGADTPSGTKAYGTTPATGLYSRYQCYMPAGTLLQDETGTYKFTQNCNYQK